MFSGVDYVFYSSKNPFDIEKDFISLLTMVWPNPIIEAFERNNSRLELFFAKDEEMYSFFDVSCYDVNQSGEGCFMLISSLIERLDSEVIMLDISYPERKRNTEPYNSTFILHNIWEYTLILPAEFSESKFCSDVYSGLINILK
ncbi:hypothetical protein [Klebsiella aerogenes]|uniref:hypothetical protein n=1 Tax=Klebsiella aerogenes TaxID=548 RepID=UPI0022774158|nr:hypothetical protein [Klebsiella aerogenes]MCY4764354.1 hypothetical protein [Klebsiella aerogenes]